jgi:hypothetical protein
MVAVKKKLLENSSTGLIAETVCSARKRIPRQIKKPASTEIEAGSV